MMAKMFYTLEEAKAALGKSEDEIKQYAREGRLREFRDGPRLMFKADQVEQLKSEIDTGTPDIGVSDSGGLIGLVDTTGASGTSITLSEADTGQSSVAGLAGAGSSGSGMRLSGSGIGMNLGGSAAGMSNAGMSGVGMSGGSGIGMAPSGTGLGMSPAGSAPGISLRKDDTNLAADLGLSGSLGGVPSPGRPGGGTGLSGTATSRQGGVNVFGADDDDADPSAQTAISGGIREQVNLEGVGSGSGLLDLTRESDDTSLGAVLDEITPGAGGGRRAAMSDTDAGTGISGMDEFPSRRSSGGSAAVAPVYVQPLDPMAPAFGAMALAGFGALMFGIFVLISAMAGTWPEATRYFNNKAFYIPVAFGLAGALVLFVIGLLIGKAGGRR